MFVKRSRSNDGTPNRASRVLPISPGLLAKLTAEFAEVRERAAPKVFHGPKAAREHKASNVSDEQVLSIRRMHLWHGMTEGQIAEVTGLPVFTIENYTRWKNRVHLDPGPAPSQGA